MALKLDIPETSDGKKMRTRSPAYPFVNLETALRRAKEFYAAQQHHAAPLKVAVKLWGYEEKSSGGLQTAAALVSFGLLNDEGTSDGRKVRLTPLALKILLNPDLLGREEAIKQVALTPKIHRQVWNKWGAKPPEASMRYALLTEWEPRFNPNTVDTFIREYRDTIAFAKLSESDKVSSEGEGSADQGGKPAEPKIGDFVQWEHNGVLGFPESKRLTGFSEDGDFAFVEGYKSGIPTDEIIPGDPPGQPSPIVPLRNLVRMPEGAKMRQDVFSLTEGEAIIHWPTPLSADSISELEDWLELVKRKIKRSGVEPEKSKAQETWEKLDA